MLVAEGHRLERENRFASLVHRFDLLLEPRRGSSNTELTGGVYYYGASCYRHAKDAGDKGAVLSSLLTDPNLGRFTRHTYIADINVVAARREIRASIGAQRDVI